MRWTHALTQIVCRNSSSILTNNKSSVCLSYEMCNGMWFCFFLVELNLFIIVFGDSSANLNLKGFGLLLLVALFLAFSVWFWFAFLIGCGVIFCWIFIYIMDSHFCTSCIYELFVFWWFSHFLLIYYFTIKKRDSL